MEKGTKTPHSHVNPRMGSNTNTAFTAALCSYAHKQKKIIAQKCKLMHMGKHKIIIKHTHILVELVEQAD